MAFPIYGYRGPTVFLDAPAWAIELEDVSMKVLGRIGWALAALGASFCASAQDALDRGWHYLVEPYVMFPNMEGDVGIGNLPPAHVDEDPGDIFDNLQIGAMLYAEAHNDRWAFSSDVIYMDLEADLAERTIITGGKAGAKQLGWELAALARLSAWMELGLALTYNKIESDIRIDTVLSTLRGGLEEDWVDPSMVVRATIPLGDQWFLQGRGNIGGWGVGSDLFWQLQGDVGYRISSRFLMTLGYRYIFVDYDHGSGSDRFVYDMGSFGPTLKFGFTF